MADAPVTETSSTPNAAPADAAPAVADASPPSTAPVTEPVKAAELAKAAEPTTTEPVKEPVKAEPSEPAKEAPLFTLPEDFKPPESMVAKFTEFAKAHPKEAQETADLYVGLAREANTAWQKQIEATDKANKAACEQAFTAEELAAAETAVGFFQSYNPGFRDFAKRQLNDPLFTLVMRYVGEQLSEDSVGSSPRPPTPPGDNRPLRIRAQEKLYGGKPS